MNHSLPNVVMTGYSGFLGQAFCRYWQEHALPFNIIGLQRSKCETYAKVLCNSAGGTIVIANLADFLDGKLAVKSLNAVLHLAGLTKWSATREEAFAANVQLTEQLCAVLKTHYPGTRLVFTSTAMARPFKSAVPAKYISDGREFHNYYELSKHTAERTIESSGLRYITIRPPLISGERTSGWCINYQGIYHLFRLYARGYLPVMVMDCSLPVNAVSCDDVAREAHNAIEASGAGYSVELRGNGLKTDQLMVLARNRINGFRVRHGKSELPPVRMINFEQWTRLFRPMILEKASKATRNSLDVMDNFLPYLNISSYQDEHQRIVTARCEENYYVKIIDYWCKENQGLVLKEPFSWSVS